VTPEARDGHVFHAPLHELRNYLTIIVGFCDLLLERTPEADAKHADLVEVHKAGHAALAVLADLSGRRSSA
jgi:hypothetical protein